jgi:N-succinyldiaminopimelate aminotransferase
VNPHLSQLQPYPFEKLRRFLADVTPAAHLREIRLSIGEPQHATPDFIKTALSEGLSGLANYPSTAGTPALRQSIASWIGRRYDIPAPDAETQVLPVNGSREALFAFAQTVIDGSQPGALVVCPNPFYQIYEGAALLAGAQPVFINTLPQNNFNLDLQTLSEEQWRRVQLLYVCTPGNPTGKVLALDDWRELFALSDRYGFVIASDECYSEIYFDEQKKPLGGLEAARKLGRDDYRRLVMFSSLSKRSNVPGMRSGFVAGDKALIQKFLLYRTYHGSAMSPAIQAASIAAWNDEAHVIENRRLYREKFAQVTPVIAEHLGTAMPDAGFYLWASVDKIVDKAAAKYATFDDTEFARELLRQYNVSVLPGSYLARDADGINPGSNFIRIALVADPAECLEGAQRIADFCRKL